MVKDPVIAPSGYATSSGYSMTVTIGQPSIGTSTAAAGNVRELRSGFEYFPYVSKPTPTALSGDASASLSWSPSTGFLGWTVSGYSIGHSTVSGGPYTYTAVGNVTSATVSSLTNGTAYYFVVVPKDFFGNIIATSTEVSATPVASTPSPTPAPGGGGGIVYPPGVTPPFTTPPTFPPRFPPIILPPFTEPPIGDCSSVADLNCDGYVDIIDFSIMYYWFDKKDPPARIDLAKDGKVDLADFSVMAYYWYERPV
ncbi:MAG: hypothetical protein A3C13_04760 [Candidatus Lloydbacteria bacterium RIFCSPHIGHO2_02_FULL_50_11]|nr:MAG: hypothetical protein A3C13_04760 [Candidatus Lloydbacteria bacterium RIFCSPHIGHO2_02_FULL_50_11]